MICMWWLNLNRPATDDDQQAAELVARSSLIDSGSYIFKDLDKRNILNIVTRQSLATQEKRGVKVNYRFEAEVWSELL